MNTESFPPIRPGEKPKKKIIPIEGGGEAHLSAEEQLAHEAVEKRRRTLMEKQETHEVEESGTPRKFGELTEEEQELLAEMVSDEQTRAKLDPEVIESFLRLKKEEKRDAA